MGKNDIFCYCTFYKVKSWPQKNEVLNFSGRLMEILQKYFHNGCYLFSATALTGEGKDLKLLFYLSSVTLPTVTKEVLLVCISWISH